jgi:hypothetical protein
MHTNTGFWSESQKERNHWEYQDKGRRVIRKYILIIGLCILLRVYQLIYVETSVHNKCRCSFYCALFTLHVSAPIGGHLQAVCNTKNSKSVTVCVNGSVASIRTKANAVVG